MPLGTKNLTADGMLNAPLEMFKCGVCREVPLDPFECLEQG